MGLDGLECWHVLYYTCVSPILPIAFVVFCASYLASWSGNLGLLKRIAWQINRPFYAADFMGLRDLVHMSFGL